MCKHEFTRYWRREHDEIGGKGSHLRAEYIVLFDRILQFARSP